MRTNVTANITNIIFNALLINGLFFFPELGVKGAAIATLIGNMASFGMSLYSLFEKNGYLRLNIKGMVFWRMDQLKTLAKVAVGASTEQLVLRVGFFIFAKVVADLGTAETATHTICMNIMLLSFASGDGLGVAASALMGQNLGKKRPDLATLYVKTGQRIGLAVSAFLVLFFVFGGSAVLRLFAEESDPNFTYVMQTGGIIMYFIAFVSPGQISQVISSGALRGAGDTKYVAVTSMISLVIFRTFMAYVLCVYTPLGLFGAWSALIVDQYVRLLFAVYRFKSGKWMNILI
jgi:putative MATE family efflux protein